MPFTVSVIPPAVVEVDGDADVIFKDSVGAAGSVTGAVDGRALVFGAGPQPTNIIEIKHIEKTMIDGILNFSAEIYRSFSCS